MNKKNDGWYEGGAVINGYTLLEVIGKGQFGKVVKARDSKDRLFAIKIIQNPANSQNYSKCPFQSHEASILLQLIHPNVIEFVDEFQFSDHLYIVYEFCNQGSVHKLLVQKGKLPETMALFVFREILQALGELESCGIVHRDVKTENVFLKDNHVKLGDFGLSTDSHSRSRRLVGSPIYMAPEALQSFHYTHKGDVYAAGITLFKLLTNTYPFVETNINALLEAKHYFDVRAYAASLSPKMVTLLAACLDPDFNRRPNSRELIRYLDLEFPQVSKWNPDFESKTKPLSTGPPPLTRGFTIQTNREPERQAPSQPNPLMSKFGGKRCHTQIEEPVFTLPPQSFMLSPAKKPSPLSRAPQFPPEYEMPPQRRPPEEPYRVSGPSLEPFDLLPSFGMHRQKANLNASGLLREGLGGSDGLGGWPGGTGEHRLLAGGQPHGGYEQGPMGRAKYNY